jgi:hypothetical protein
LSVSQFGGAVKCSEIIGEYEERVQAFISISRNQNFIPYQNTETHTYDDPSL